MTMFLYLYRFSLQINVYALATCVTYQPTYIIACPYHRTQSTRRCAIGRFTCLCILNRTQPFFKEQITDKTNKQTNIREYSFGLGANFTLTQTKYDKWTKSMRSTIYGHRVVLQIRERSRIASICLNWRRLRFVKHCGRIWVSCPIDLHVEHSICQRTGCYLLRGGHIIFIVFVLQFFKDKNLFTYFF